MKRAVSLLIAGVVAAAPATASAADPPQPPLDYGVLKSLWKPAGFFKPGDSIPLPDAPPTPTAGAIFNPSGHWSAYDSNVYESLNFPGRGAGDTSNKDAPGSGLPVFGFCPPDPAYVPAGKCVNHGLEYLDYYEATMKDLLKDYGVAVHRYEFDNPGSGGAPVGIPAGLSSPAGKTYNIAAVVPGADHPEQEVIVSGHWDFTDAGPAAAWDSSEGHTEVIRIAKIMSDYWRATGTRPAVTVKFMPWAAEESGTYGSLDYVTNYIADEDDAARIRGYFNMDPCAGAFPAFYHGNPAEQVPQVNQLSDPAQAQDPEKVTAFNTKAKEVIDRFWADIDDTVDSAAGPMPVFTDADRGQIVTAVGGLAVFSSDYANFEAVGVPIFNLFPDMFGPHADGTPASAEGAATIHTARDNLQSLNALTSADQTGLTASDGWMTGMEECAHIEGRYMLQPEMSGTQTANLDPVAYMEPFKAKAEKGKLVTFDGSGSYQYAQLATRGYVDEKDLQLKWDFGDGSAPAYGKVVQHAYAVSSKKPFTATLTVTNRDTQKADTASRKVLVLAGTGTDADPAAQAADAGARPPGSIVTCQRGGGFKSAAVSADGAQLRFDAALAVGDTYQAEVLQVSSASRSRAPRKVASFAVKAGAFTWKPATALAAGTYVVRITARGSGARADVRGFAFKLAGGRFGARKAFQRADTCGLLSLARLDSPAFGPSRKLLISFATTKRATVTVRAFRGRKRVAIAKVKVGANRLGRVTVSPKGLRRGLYRVVISAVAGGAKASQTLYATRY